MTVPTLDGEAELDFDPGTQPGEVRVLRGKGMPVLQGFGRGNQHVRVNVAVPRRLTDEQRDCSTEFGEHGRRRGVRGPRGRGVLPQAQARVPVVRASIPVPPAQAEAAVARLLELVPAGHEVDGERRLAVYVDDDQLARRCAPSSPTCTVERVEPGWEDAWRRFHTGVRIGPLWVGPPWEEPPAGAEAIVIDPGRAFGTAPTRRHGSRSSCSPRSSRAAACSTSAAAPAWSRSPPPGSGSRPCARSTTTRSRSRRPRENAERNGVTVDAAVLDARLDALAAATSSSRTSRSTSSRRSRARVRCRDLVLSGYPAADTPASPA